MARKKPVPNSSNIINLSEYGGRSEKKSREKYDEKEVSEFIVDMLETLMSMAARNDHSLLVYFLAMARIEAKELGENSNSNIPPEKPPKSRKPD